MSCSSAAKQSSSTLTLRDLANLGGDQVTLPWRSLTTLDENMIYVVQNIRRAPKNAVIRVDQIVVECKTFQTALPQRYVEHLMYNEENFQLFCKETHFLVFCGLRKTKMNLNFAVINTTLPTHINRCVCKPRCDMCSCDKYPAGSCICWVTHNFEN